MRRTPFNVDYFTTRVLGRGQRLMYGQQDWTFEGAGEGANVWQNAVANATHYLYRSSWDEAWPTHVSVLVRIGAQWGGGIAPKKIGWMGCRVLMWANLISSPPFNNFGIAPLYASELRLLQEQNRTDMSICRHQKQLDYGHFGFVWFLQRIGIACNAERCSWEMSICALL